MTPARALLVRLVAALVLSAGALGGAAAEPSPAAGVVTEATGADRLLIEDGTRVRLAGIRVPEALEAAAKALLAELVVGRKVQIEPAPIANDRYGNLVAQVERADRLWLQGALLEQGLALVHTRPGETARAADMLAIERAARKRKAGLWRLAELAPRAAGRAHEDVGRFALVVGRIHRVAPTDDYVYLNFEEDWRTDFTVRLRQEELDGRFARSGIDVENLAGRRIEVRGFVLEAGGPLIEVSHPEQIEVAP